MSTALPDLVCVDPARIDEIWPLAKNFIRSAIYETHLSDFDLIEDDVLCGDQLLWLVWNGESIEGAGTTELVSACGVKTCIITAFGGKGMDRWLPLEQKITEYAKAEGASTVRIYGRRGWERVLDGYQAKYVILEKALN